MEVILSLLLVVTILAVIVMALQLGPARAASSRALKEAAETKERLNLAEQEIRKTNEALSAKRRETDELKDRVRDVKRRRQEEREADRFQRDLQQARDEIEREMERKLAHSREEAEEARTAMRRLSAEVDAFRSRRPVQPETPPAPVEPRVREVRPDELVRLEAAEKGLREAREKLNAQSNEIKAFKGRAETERRVYLVQKKEIELARDKFRALEQRHNALVHERDELRLALYELEKQLKGLMPTAAATEPAAAPVKPVEPAVPEATIAHAEPASPAAPIEKAGVEG